MCDITVFENSDFGKIRTIIRDGEPWFVGSDVARSLGYANNRKALSDHVDDEDKGVTKCDTLGGAQDLTVINESGLYSLILSSNLPTAKAFKRWILHDVLPTIRKHGMYANDALLNDPDALEAEARRIRQEKETSLTEQVSTLTSDNKQLVALVASYEKRLFIRDHIKEIFDFINKCVRSYSAIKKGGNMGYGWKDYYDRLADELGTDIRERGKPYIDRITDDELPTAIRVAGKISVRPVNTIVSDDLIELMKKVAA